MTHGGESGVYFLSLDSGLRLTAAVGRRAFGLPFHHATMRLTRRDDRITFRSRRRRRGSETPTAVFGTRYRPDGPVFEADPDTLESFCVERFRYFSPPSEDRRLDALRPSSTAVRAGTIDRDPWRLQPVEATVRRNTLFEAAGLPTPTSEPIVQYSPGFEMRVGPLETRGGTE